MNHYLKVVLEKPYKIRHETKKNCECDYLIDEAFPSMYRVSQNYPNILL